MNVWDLTTWVASAALAGSAVLIFSGFVRDARHVFLAHLRGEDEVVTASDELPPWPEETKGEGE